MALPAPARAGLTVAGLTATATILGGLFPELAPRGDPHPVLHGTIAEAAEIAATNLRVLSAPFLLALLGLHHGARRRRIGDLAIALLATVNTVQVGLALGADGPNLIPYVPQLPLEWAALTLCLATWLELRAGDAARDRLGRYAAAILAFTITAAAVETFATPHGNPHVPTAGLASRSAVSPVWGAGGGVPSARLCAGRPGRFKVADAPFPSLRSVPLDRPGAFLGFVNHPRTPTRRDHNMNSMCVIWNSLQIAHSVGFGCSASTADSDRCRC